MQNLSTLESVATELCIKQEELLKTINNLDIQILLEPQKEIEIYITNPQHLKDQIPFFEKITKDNILLCIASHDLNKGGFLSEFSHISCFSEGKYEIHTACTWRLTESLKKAAITNTKSFANAVRDSVSTTNIETLRNSYSTPDLVFSTFTASKYNSTTEPPRTSKSIYLAEARKYLRKSDVTLIKKALLESQPEYGVFVPGDWTSHALRVLNEASTYFFRTDHNRDKNLSKEEVKEIQEWLRKKWKEKGNHHGIDLRREARKIITPSKISLIQIERSAFSRETLSQYNEYDSTCLIAINETAKKFHTTQPKAESVDIQQYLESTYEITAKAAEKAAVIIIGNQKNSDH